MKNLFIKEKDTDIIHHNTKKYTAPISVSASNYFSFENNLLNAIENGDSKLLDALWNSPTGIVLGNIPSAFKQPIYVGLPLLTIMRRAAIIGGADIEDAFLVYDSFSNILIKEKTSADSYITVAEASYTFCKLVEKRQTLGRNSLYAKKCTQYISTHIGDKITINDLSIVCGQSPRQVSRIFKLCFNMGVAEFISSERIQMAKELLSSSNAKIVEIGNSLGFSSQSHFTKVFSDHLGCTPKEYRNRSKQL